MRNGGFGRRCDFNLCNDPPLIFQTMRSRRTEEKKVQRLYDVFDGKALLVFLYLTLANPSRRVGGVARAGSGGCSARRGSGPW
jgi:hypothetical protein